MSSWSMPARPSHGFFALRFGCAGGGGRSLRQQCLDYRAPIRLIKKGQPCLSRKQFRIPGQQGAQSSPTKALDLKNIARWLAPARGCSSRLRGAGSRSTSALRQAAQLCRPVLVQAPDSLPSVAFRDMARTCSTGSDGKPAGSSISCSNCYAEGQRFPKVIEPDGPLPGNKRNSWFSASCRWSNALPFI